MKSTFKSLQLKLIVFFAITTLFTSLITLSVISFTARNLREAPPSINLEFPYENLSRRELRQKLAEQIQQDRQTQQSTLLIITILILSFQIILATLGSVWIVKRSLSPINNLNKIMSQINSLDLKHKISTEGADKEIVSLIENFNSMIVRIQLMIDKEKEFLHNISHELRTPLSAIRVNVESIIIEENVDLETQNSLKTVISSIDSLNKLIEDLTLLTSIEKKKFNVENFNLVNVINESIEQVKKANSSTKFSIDFANTYKDIYIKGSRELFKRAISNLIENSLKYTNTKPQINILLEDTKSRVVIIVKDNGVGISTENLNKVFERFYRVDGSRSKSTGGVGLGLSLVKEIVDSLKGEIKVNSKVGEGSEFIIKIPKD